MKSYKGRFTPTNPEKYVGDVTNIIYRSLLELRFMKFCDKNPNILEWAAEEIIIPYYSPVDKKLHRYFPDFWVVIKDKTGNTKKIIIEVKPYVQCFPPKTPKRKTKRYYEEMRTYCINQAKWTAAKQFCESNNIKFDILTEKHLK